MFQNIVFSRGMALLVFLTILFVGYGLVSIIGKSIDASNARKVAENQANSLKAKQVELSSKIDMLKTPEGQEKSLREQFPVVKEGEHVVVITDGAQNKKPDIGALPASNKSHGFWNFLRNLFK